MSDGGRTPRPSGGSGPDSPGPASSSASRILGLWRVPFFYGWVIVAAVFVGEFMAAGVGTFVVPMFFEPMSREMGWSLTLVTVGVTAQTVAYSGLAPVLGYFLDRFGARPVMLFGAIAAGTGLLMLTQVREVWHFWILYATVGALGLHEIGGFTGPVLITKWFVRFRGRAMAIATMGTTIGGMVMAPIVGALIATVGWRGAWQILGVLVLVVMVPLVLVFIRRQPEDMGLLPDGEKAGEAPPAGAAGVAGEPASGQEREQASGHRGGDKVERRRNAPAEITWTLKEAMRTRTLWLLVVAMNLVHVSATAIVVHMVPFLTLQEGLSAPTAGLVVSARLVASTISRAIWGLATERFPINLCLGVAFASRAMNPLTLVLLPYPLNVAGVVLTSFTGSGFQVLQPMAFANYFGRRYSGTILGSVRPFLTVATLVGPLLIAAVYDLTGTFTPAFVFAGGLGLVSAVIALFATAPRKKEAHAQVA